MSKFEIAPGMSVSELRERLQAFDGRQQLLTQVILPDGEPWNAPFVVAEVPGSNVGGQPYIVLQARCDETV